jgi:putative transposase
MKLIAQVKLRPAPEQAGHLRQTFETTNTAANAVSNYAWETKTFRQYDLHHALYYDIRQQFNLAAQVVVRLLAKVADAYKLDRKIKRTFKPHGSITYDKRILSWNLADQTVSIWTVVGRQTIPFVTGEYHLALLASMQGEADLVYRRGQFYLYQTCDVDEPPTDDVEEFLGIDLGIANIAADSDGHTYSGKTIKNVRYRHRRLRQKLQRKGTKSAKRRLRTLSGKEQRFAKDVNHTISKKIVAAAKDTGRGIALEDLSGIRDRVRLRRSQRATLHNWSFYQLRLFVEYKAHRAGVPVIAVDPRNTSRTCPACGSVDKCNRPSQAVFSCIQCGFSGHADYIAAGNIARRAAVNPPYVSAATPVVPGTS